MAKKTFTYKGIEIETLSKMSVKEFADITNARIRRSIERGFTPEQKILLDKLNKDSKNVKTHCRNMPILPSMVGLTIGVHDGKTFQPIMITAEMLGHYLGEFSICKKKVHHSAPGIGATRSSTGSSVK